MKKAEGKSEAVNGEVAVQLEVGEVVDAATIPRIQHNAALDAPLVALYKALPIGKAQEVKVVGFKTSTIMDKCRKLKIKAICRTVEGGKKVYIHK